MPKVQGLVALVKVRVGACPPVIKHQQLCLQTVQGKDRSLLACDQTSAAVLAGCSWCAARRRRCWAAVRHPRWNICGFVSCARLPCAAFFTWQPTQGLSSSACMCGSTLLETHHTLSVPRVAGNSLMRSPSRVQSGDGLNVVDQGKSNSILCFGSSRRLLSLL